MEALLPWFDAHRRNLPWRVEPRDPYRVWVSEVMLQQTRVETVLRYYGRFIERFPDVAALASAREDDVMKAWEGLGYYRRARAMHQAAREVVDRHGGALPRDAAALRALPGFGPYTVGAVASLAWGAPLPAVDGNVVRVYARLHAEATPDARAVGSWVLAHQPAGRAGAFNEALMELGATVCTPRAPRCDACPLARACAGRARSAEGFPAVKAKRASPVQRVAVALVRRGKKVLVEKRESGLLAGTWVLPSVELGQEEDARAALREHVAAMTGGAVDVGGRARRARHVFTHRTWAIEAYDASTTGRGGVWRDPDEIAVATAHRKLL